MIATGSLHLPSRIQSDVIPQRGCIRPLMYLRTSNRTLLSFTRRKP